MKQAAILLFAIAISFAGTAHSQTPPAVPTQTLHLATALDHITVLEFGEPVTLAAAGSSAFNIEWHENKVLIKPLRQGASSDLFIWTASRRFAYELDPPGEAKNMNYAVDNPTLAKTPPPIPSTDARMTEVADMVLTHAFLGTDKVEGHDVRSDKGRVTVRVESVFQSANSLYIRCSIQNRTAQPYRVLTPTVYELIPVGSTVSLSSFRRTQLDGRGVQKLGESKRSLLELANAEIAQQDIAPGEATRIVIVLRQQFTVPTVFKIVFANAGDRNVSAVFVF